MLIPYDDELGVHPQAEGFTEHEAWDFDATAPDQYPLLLHFPYFDLYRKQVVKQADLVLAMHLRGDAFTAEQKARNFAYYERAHRPRLVAVGVHPGGDRRRGRPPRPRLRLPRRGRADGPRRPRAQHARRAAHRLARGDLDRAGRRLRRHARPRRGRSASRRGCRRRSRRLAFRVLLPRATAAGRGRSQAGDLLVAAGIRASRSSTMANRRRSARNDRSRAGSRVLHAGEAPTQPAGRAPQRRGSPQSASASRIA